MFDIPENGVSVVDSHHGIYAPQIFVEKYKSELLESGLNKDMIEDVFQGPGNKYYYDSWDYISSNTFNLDGVKFSIYEDMDIFIVPVFIRGF